MSRIEEALRRAGVPPARPAPSELPGRDVFVSAWSVAEPEGHPATVVPRPQIGAKTADSESVPRLRVVRPTAIDGFKTGLRERLTIGAEADRALSHEFGRLAATLIQAQGAQPLKTVMITSAVPNDGK